MQFSAVTDDASPRPLSPRAILNLVPLPPLELDLVAPTRIVVVGHDVEAGRRLLDPALDDDAVVSALSPDAALPSEGAVDVALLVVTAADDPAAWVGRWRAARSARCVVVLSAPDLINGKALMEALTAGADGWLSVELAPDVLLRSVRGALRGEPGLSRAHVGELVAFLRTPPVDVPVDARLAGLTPREHDVAVALIDGHAVKEIAQRLNLSEVTVRWYSSRVLRKLDVGSRYELAGLLATPVVPVVADPTAVGSDVRAAGRQHRGPVVRRTPDATVLPIPVDWRTLPGSEQRVVDLVVQGLTNRQIAEKLFLSKHTVDSHLKSAFAKLGVRSRVALTVLVHQQG